MSKNKGLDLLEHGHEPPSPELHSPEPQHILVTPGPSQHERDKIPSSPPIYESVRNNLRSAIRKLDALMSSPTRQVFRQADRQLVRGSLHELELAQAQQGALRAHKMEVSERKAVQVGGYLYAMTCSKRIRQEPIDSCTERVKTCRRLLQQARKRVYKQWQQQGIDDRQRERERRKVFVLGLERTLLPEIIDRLVRPKSWEQTAIEDEEMKAATSSQ